MAFAIRWSKRAERYLSRLPAEVARQIAHRVNKVKKELFNFWSIIRGQISIS